MTKSLEFSKSGLTTLFPETFNQQVQKFYQPSEVGLKLLDFGCGSELFLNSAREQGWNTIGIDFSPQSVEQVRAHRHQALLMSSQVWDEIEDESLDCVRMNHVLEHLYHPQKNLQAIYSKMKPGGILHIGVPNPYSITSRIFRSRWFSLECPRHIMLYSPALLKKILTSMGFSEIKILHQTVTKDFLRSCGYVLYDLDLISKDEIAKMAQRRYLSNLLYPLARLASAFGVADRHDVFCTKPD
ncbi:MAG: class I SAM-dependent methyltransferase [Waterburya sp.]